MRSLILIFLALFLTSCSNEENISQNSDNQLAQETHENSNETEYDNALVDEGEVNSDQVEVAEIIDIQAIPSEINEVQSAVDEGTKEAVTDQDSLGQDPITEQQKIKNSEISTDHALRIPFYFYLLLGLFIATLISLVIVVSLLLKEVRWRKRRSDNESIVFPDAHLDILDDLRHAWENLYKQIIEFTNLGLSNQKENENLAIKTMDSISKFNSTIDAQQNEINRLKEGYDFSIKKHSALALIEINELVEGFLDDTASDLGNEKLSKVDGYVKSNLEDMDIEEFSFETGLSIRDLSPDEFEIDSVEKITENELHEKIKETTKKGYAFIHSNGKNIIRKAKVKVYKKED